MKRHHNFHINVLRKWNAPSAAVFLAEGEGIDSLINGKEKVNIHTTLLSPNLIELGKFKERYRDVLQDIPGRTSLVPHNILTGDALPPPPPSETAP